MRWKFMLQDDPENLDFLVRHNLEELVALALDENTLCDMEREYSDNFLGCISHTPDASQFNYTFGSPMTHERLEARLQFSEWLGSRVSREDLERLSAT